MDQVFLKSKLTASTIIVLLAFCFGHPVAAQVDLCLKTATDTLTSCRQNAESDFSLAIAKCDNFPTAGKRKTCQQQAAVDKTDALQACDSQYAVRQSACGRFGPAPYAPIINPNNFVSGIDNPYFPLTP